MRYFFIVILILGCTNPNRETPYHADSALVFNVFSKNPTINYSTSFSSDTTYYLSEHSVFVQNSTKFMKFVDDHSIFLIDENFNLVKQIRFINFDFLLEGKITSACQSGNKVYMVSNYKSVVSIDITTNKIEKIDLKDPSGFNYYRTISDIKVDNDQSLYVSYLLLPAFNQIDTSYILGVAYSKEGEMIEQFSLPKDIEESHIWKEIVDEAKLALFNDQVIFNFMAAKNAFMFSKNGELIKTIEAQVDLEFWQEPEFEYNLDMNGNEILKSKFSPVSLTCFQIYGNLFSYLQFRNDSPPFVLFINKEYEVVDKLILDNIPEQPTYKFYIAENKLILQNQGEIYIIIDPLNTAKQTKQILH